ncbi:MAG: hypothetical protein H6799_00180 [Candidatus Nomurabacteria bacterium]|nr:MAG: hypothetical protein H6799_00180 [Candidatus Nomurabacteria bacterium]
MKTNKFILRKSSLFISSLTFAALLLASLGATNISPVNAAPPPDGITLTVNSVGNDGDVNQGDGNCETATPGECTLAAAIQEASANSNPTFRDIIEFNIAGAGVHTISPSSTLYTGAEPVLINGYSQSGSTANSNAYPDPFNGTLLIELDFSNLANANDTGLALGSSLYMTGLILNSNNVGNTVSAYTVDDVHIYGNYFNTDYSGLIAKPGGENMGSIGINGSTNIFIGGSQPAERNLFGPAATNIFIGEANPDSIQSSDIDIKGNYFGVGSDGVTNLGTLQFSHISIVDQSTDISIGGPNVEDGNTVENAYSGAISIGNNWSDSTLAPERILIQHNRIVANGWAGVTVGDFLEPYAYAQNVSILQNSMYLNGTRGDGSSPGIDLILPSESNLNDPLDVDEGANHLLNSPVYLDGDVVESGGDTTIKYGIDVPAGDYRVEFFSSPTKETAVDLEGYEFLGYQNITSAGSGYQMFSNTLSGDGHQNITLTATEIKPDLPFGFGATSEFGGERMRQSDVGVVKTLTNPEDVAPNSTVTYHLDYTNHGPDPLILSDFNIPFATSPLFYDYMPPDLSPSNLIGDGPLPGLSYVDVNNPDLTCLWSGPGSGGTILGLTKYASYSAVFCWYTGSDDYLNANDIISADIEVTIAADSELAFANFIYAPSSIYTHDPDEGEIFNSVATGDDQLDGLYKAFKGVSPFNNFSATYLPGDIDVSASLTNPQDVAVGNIINYDITLTNNGTTGINLPHYISPSYPLLGGAYPAENLTFIGATNEGITCQSYGPGSIAYWPSATDHQSHQLFACVYSGDSISDVVLPGESYTIHLQMRVDEVTNFTSYFLIVSVTDDPDLLDTYADLIGAETDQLDIVSNPNFARVSYINGESENNSGSPNSDNTNTSNNTLSKTGQSIILLIAAGSVLVLLSSLIYKKTKNTKS